MFKIDRTTKIVSASRKTKSHVSISWSIALVGMSLNACVTEPKILSTPVNRRSQIALLRVDFRLRGKITAWSSLTIAVTDTCLLFTLVTTRSSPVFCRAIQRVNSSKSLSIISLSVTAFREQESVIEFYRYYRLHRTTFWYRRWFGQLVQVPSLKNNIFRIPRFYSELLVISMGWFKLTVNIFYFHI